MYILRIRVLENGFAKILYIILDLVFIILLPFLNIINVDRTIKITNIFLSPKLENLPNLLHHGLNIFVNLRTVRIKLKFNIKKYSFKF